MAVVKKTFKMKKRILYFMMLWITFSCNKNQEKEVLQKKKEEFIVRLPPPPPKKIDENSLVGFACYYSGRKSKPVKEISEILVKKEYSRVKEKLYSINTAEKYLATVICERLLQKRLITLTENELKQIEKNEVSNEKVTICSGCTHGEELTIKKMFSSNENFLSKSIEEWLKDMIK
jgi:hypothetical protein